MLDPTPNHPTIDRTAIPVPLQWYDEGSFVPYADELLIETVLDAKAAVQPWVRLNRIVRDIPSYYIKGGINAPSLRQALPQLLQLRGQACRCIRCREVGAGGPKHAGRAEGAARAVLVERRYVAQGGDETFLSVETPGACRGGAAGGRGLWVWRARARARGWRGLARAFPARARGSRAAAGIVRSAPNRPTRHAPDPHATARPTCLPFNPSLRLLNDLRLSAAARGAALARPRRAPRLAAPAARAAMRRGVGRAA